MFKAYIFDFDLTLADTATGIVSCCNYALEHMGHPLALPEDIFVCIGKTVAETYDILTGIDDPDEALKFNEHWRQKANEIGNKCTTLFPDTIDVLTRLKSAGKKVAIVSNKTTHRIESVLRDFGIEHLIDFVLGIELHDEPKPRPGGLLMALERFGITADCALYIGDSLVDMRTANNAGVTFAAVTTGPIAAGAFKIAGAQHVFYSLTKIADKFLLGS